MSSINPPRSERAPVAPHELLEDALFQVKRVIVGQDRMVERPLVCLLARGHCLHRRRPRSGQDPHRLDAGPRSSAARSPASSSPPTSCPPTSSAPASGVRRARSSTSSGARSSPTSSWPTRSTGRRPRCSPRCSRSWPSGQVSIGGQHRSRCPSPFLVLATQNPIESEGVYALPEAQRDRFLMQIVVDHPSLRRGDRDRPADGRATRRRPSRCSPSSSCCALQAAADEVFVHHAVADYAVRLVMATRDPATWGLPELAPHARRSVPAPAPRSACSPPAGPSPCCGAGASSLPAGRLRRGARGPAATASSSPTTRWPRASQRRDHRPAPDAGRSPGSRPTRTRPTMPPPPWRPTRSPAVPARRGQAADARRAHRCGDAPARPTVDPSSAVARRRRRQGRRAPPARARRHPPPRRPAERRLPGRHRRPRDRAGRRPCLRTG